MKSSISIIGAGSMGTALAILLSKIGHRVKMWSAFGEEVEMINKKRNEEFWCGFWWMPMLALKV